MIKKSLGSSVSENGNGEDTQTRVYAVANQGTP